MRDASLSEMTTEAAREIVFEALRVTYARRRGGGGGGAGAGVGVGVGVGEGVGSPECVKTPLTSQAAGNLLDTLAKSNLVSYAGRYEVCGSSMAKRMAELLRFLPPR